MYGLILVEPVGGLPHVDREYYVTQGEVYTTGGYGEPGLQSFSWEKALAESPDYSVFNGVVGSRQHFRRCHARHTTLGRRHGQRADVRLSAPPSTAHNIYYVD